MERVSSNLTLFFKFFIPVFWIVFFGAFTVATLLYKFEFVGNIPALQFRIGVVFFFISGVAMFLLTLGRLKRVELTPEYIYVTNYFKHYRYPYASVEKLEVSQFLFIGLGVIYLKEKGSIGKRITFLASNFRLNSFWKQYPELRAQIVKD